MDSSDLFIKYFKKVNLEVVNCFEKWMELRKEKREFSNNEINIRFMKLKKPFNTYCKTNYIDYNSVVDKILRMSLPYNENKQKDQDQELEQESIPTINDNSSQGITSINLPQSQSLDKKELPFHITEYIQNSNAQTNSNSNNVNQKTKLSPKNNIQINFEKELKNKNSPASIIIQDSQYNKNNNNSNNLKVNVTSSNAYLPGIFYSNNTYKIEDNFINPECKIILIYYSDIINQYS